MVDKSIKQDFVIAFTHMQNKQNISAHNLFLRIAEREKKSDSFRSALLYVLAAECKARQGKDNHDEFMEAGKLYLKMANKESHYDAKGAYLCAAKCFLRVGQYDDAKNAFEKSKKLTPKTVGKTRPVVIVEDSDAVVMKLKNYLGKLGYDNVHIFNSGKEAVKASKELFKLPQGPIVLLDMGLPDIDGDIVAGKLLESKLDLPIILITADEKTTDRVRKTIAGGASAFIQKPFNIDDLHKALEKVEIDEIILKQQKGHV